MRRRRPALLLLLPEQLPLRMSSLLPRLPSLLYRRLPLRLLPPPPGMLLFIWGEWWLR